MSYHLFLQFNLFFYFSLEFLLCFSFTPNHLKSRLYRTNSMQTCIILFYFNLFCFLIRSHLFPAIVFYFFTSFFIMLFFKALTSTFSPFTSQSTLLISLNIHFCFHNLSPPLLLLLPFLSLLPFSSPPYLSFLPFLSLLPSSSSLLLIQGAFTPPSVMCCPWIDLKEELEAVDVDTGNTRLNTVKCTIL